MDRTVLTDSYGPTPVFAVHGINKKSGSLCLKNRFSSRFPIFTVWPLGPVRVWKLCFELEIYRETKEAKEKKILNVNIQNKRVRENAETWKWRPNFSNLCEETFLRLRLYFALVLGISNIEMYIFFGNMELVC